MDSREYFKKYTNPKQFEKIVEMENILSIEFVRKRAKEFDASGNSADA